MSARRLWTLALAIVACGDSVSSTHDTTTTGTTTTGTTTGTTTTDAPSTGPTSHATSHATSGGEMSPAAAYCLCMLDRCHDLYHATWGEDHVMSEQMCEAAAAAVPTVGMPAMTGDSIECRLHHCEAAATDEAQCESGGGGGVCI